MPCFLTSLLTLGSADLLNVCQPDLMKNDISILFLSVVPGLLTRLKIFSSISVCVSSFVNCQFRSLLFGHLPMEVFPNDFKNSCLLGILTLSQLLRFLKTVTTCLERLRVPRLQKYSLFSLPILLLFLSSHINL